MTDAVGTQPTYVCSRCGGGAVEVNAARPSLDDRYPLGHCMACTPWPKPKERPSGEMVQQPRALIPLVRADVFDVDRFNHHKRVAAARRLVAKLHSRRGAKMSEAELERASEAAAWLRRNEP